MRFSCVSFRSLRSTPLKNPEEEAARTLLRTRNSRSSTPASMAMISVKSELRHRLVTMAISEHEHVSYLEGFEDRAILSVVDGMGFVIQSCY